MVETSNTSITLAGQDCPIGNFRSIMSSMKLRARIYHDSLSATAEADDGIRAKTIAVKLLTAFVGGLCVGALRLAEDPKTAIGAGCLGDMALTAISSMQGLTDECMFVPYDATADLPDNVESRVASLKDCQTKLEKRLEELRGSSSAHAAAGQITTPMLDSIAEAMSVVRDSVALADGGAPAPCSDEAIEKIVSDMRTANLLEGRSKEETESRIASVLGATLDEQRDKTAALVARIYDVGSTATIAGAMVAGEICAPIVEWGLSAVSVILIAA